MRFKVANIRFSKEMVYLSYKKMNYLAHAYLSFADENILLGNMISDYVKGKQKFTYSNEVQFGINLHRAIDAYTDANETTQNVKQLYKQHYGLYAGALADVTYDYFLANDPTIFEDEAALHAFSTQTYGLLKNNTKLFPQKFATMFPYMQEQNWLYNYRLDWGMQKSFTGLYKRALYMNSPEVAFDIFLNNKKLLKELYDVFFPQLKSFVTNYLQAHSIK
jgi:acyl carrier protein phosphodiesterase